MTPKQDRFTNAIIAGNNPSDAYKQAYNAENMSASSIATEAQKLMQHPNIAPIIDKAKAESRENAVWSYTTACERLYAINTAAYLEMQKEGLKTANNALKAFLTTTDRLNKLLGIDAVSEEKNAWDAFEVGFERSIGL